MYNKIYDFCKVRNVGNIYKNHPHDGTPRVNFILELLQSEEISHYVDIFKVGDTSGYNIILKGTSNRIVVAHHDINNPNIDNANDNSASVINAIMIKKLMPEITVVLLDGEEFGGIGSQRLSTQINSGEFGEIEWILNLELTGRGGKHFFVGNYPGKLQNHIQSIFECPIVNTPFNDSVVFRRNGIDSVVINPLPPTNKVTRVKWNDTTYLDYDMLFNCHNSKDTIETIDVEDMRLFTEEIVLEILKK